MYHYAAAALNLRAATLEHSACQQLDAACNVPYYFAICRLARGRPLRAVQYVGRTYIAPEGAQLRIMRFDPAIAGAIVYTACGMAPLDISHAATEHGAGRRGARAETRTPRLYAHLLVLLIMDRSV